MHPSPHTFLPLLALSVGLCILYERTGSIWPSVVAHALNNAAAMLWLTTTLRG
jgi:membrane protease YdiL (CAAX protease family)